MKKRKIIGVGLTVFLAGVYVVNASWLAGVPDGEMSILAHRGVHQTFSPISVSYKSCTAAQIFEPSHDEIENTLSSMQAAIYSGADIIEFDIHPTTDGDFAVFHDWTLDCRTNGSGATRDHSFAELQALDIGYGYTADGGQSFPFRGKFIGAMPSLNAVLDAFPNTVFNINIKSRSAKEARALMAYIDARGGQDWARLIVNGHEAPINILREAQPDILSYSKAQVKDCAKGYMLTGWLGKMPKACQNQIFPVPVNYRKMIWGWPHRFEKRLHEVGSRSMLIGPIEGGVTTGIDGVEQLGFVPRNYKGIVFTNRAEVIGPEVRLR